MPRVSLSFSKASASAARSIDNADIPMSEGLGQQGLGERLSMNGQVFKPRPYRVGSSAAVSFQP